MNHINSNYCEHGPPYQRGNELFHFWVESQVCFKGFYLKNAGPTVFSFLNALQYPPYNPAFEWHTRCTAGNTLCAVICRVPQSDASTIGDRDCPHRIYFRYTRQSDSQNNAGYKKFGMAGSPIPRCLPVGLRLLHPTLRLQPP